MSNTVVIQLLNAPELNNYINLPSNLANALLDSKKKIHQLAFQLSWGKDNKVFVGWSGHASRVSGSLSNGRKSGNDSVVQLDAQFGMSLGLEDGLEVTLSLVKNPPLAKSVELKPCSEDDWEMVELNAQFLEDHILSQIKVLFQNQTISLNLEGKTKVRLTVVNIDPKTKNCCLISNESEVFVQPRERKVVNDLETKRDEVNLIPPTVLRSISSELFKDQLSSWIPEVPDNVAFINPRSVYSVNQLAELDFDYSKLITLGKLTLMGRLSEVQSSIESAKKVNNSNNGNQKNSGSNDNSKPPFHCPNSGIVTIIWTNIVPAQHVVIKDTLLSTLGGDLYSLFQLSSPISAHMELKSLIVRPIFIGSPDQTQLTQNNSGQTWISELVSNWIQDNLTKLKALNLLQLHLNHGMVIPLTSPSSSVMKQSVTYAYLDFSILDHFIKGNFDPPYTSIDRLSFKNISIQEGPPLFTNELPIHPPTLINSISTALAPLGAVDTVINNSISCLKVGLSGEFIKQKLKVWPHASMLLCGGKGSGKTSVAQAILKSLATDPQVLAYPITLSCETLVNDRVSKIQEKFSELVLKAAFNQPSIIFLDNLDSLIPIEMEHMDSFRYRQLAEVFIDIFKRSLAKYPRISVLATGSQSQSIHPLLLSSHIFTHTFHITPPGKPERETIINTLLSNSAVPALKNSVAHLDLSWIAGQTEGYLPTDLKSLIERALHQAAIRTIQTSKKSQLEVNQEDFRLAQEGFIPVALRGIKLQTSGVAWGDIGGLKETKAVLRETLEWPIKYSVIFKTCPLRLRSGLLLYGYPGCGKTMLASAVAKECGLNFISVKGPELLSKYIGASEKSTRDLFERASAAKPCVLFFDEFEAIAPRRGHDSTGVTDRVVNQLLTQMDGAEGLEGVYVLAATSRPDLIDPALLRPGRLDKSLICDLPSHEDRVDILKAHAAHFHLNDDVDLNWVADECEDFTGADLQAILYNAHLHAIHQNIDSKMEELNENEAKPNGIQENAKVDFSIFNSDTAKNSVVPLTMSKAERDSVERRLNKIKLNKAQSGNNLSQKLSNGGATQDQKAKSKESPKIYITKLDIEHSLKETHSSLPKSEINRLTLIYDQFKHGKSDPSKVGKRSTLG